MLADEWSLSPSRSEPPKQLDQLDKAIHQLLTHTSPIFVKIRDDHPKLMTLKSDERVERD